MADKSAEKATQKVKPEEDGRPKPEEAEKSGPEAPKVDLSTMVDQTSERIVFLKKQQESLLKQKAQLEILSEQRKELDRGKREIITNLERALAVLENEENDFQRKHALVQATREEFKKILSGVKGIREESWKAENIKEELSHALALVNRARRNYSNAQGKIEALTSRDLERGQEISRPVPEGIAPAAEPGDLFKRGWLFFLPAAILALLVMLLSRLIPLL